MNTVQLGGRSVRMNTVPYPYDEVFAGDGVETEFTLAHKGTIYLVESGGQMLRRNVDFVIDDQTVVFAVAPADGVEVGIHFFSRVRLDMYTADSSLILADNSMLTADSI